MESIQRMKIDTDLFTSTLRFEQVRIDGIGGWCYGSGHHRRPVNQGYRHLESENVVLGRRRDSIGSEVKGWICCQSV